MKDIKHLAEIVRTVAETVILYMENSQQEI